MLASREGKRHLGLLALLAGSAALVAAATGAHGDDGRSSEGISVTASAAHPFTEGSRKRRAIVWAVGDGADGNRPAKRLARRIARGRLDRFLYLGDVYEHGTYAEFRENYHSVYGRFAGKTAPTPGNHDWPLHARGYDRYWKRITGRRPPHYYSFSLAGWQILSLNSEGPHEPGSPQLRWLEDQAAGPGTCRLAFWHTPRYSAGTSHPDRPSIAPFWDALRGRATLVVNAHSHNTQAFAPIDGITQLIAGAGGHRPIHGLRRGDRRLVYADRRGAAALRLTLRRGRAAFAFISTSGRKLHSGRVSCQPGETDR